MFTTFDIVTYIALAVILVVAAIVDSFKRKK
jgi:hypothetical protein